MEATTRPLNNMNPTSFKELNFQQHPMGVGQQCIVQFSNGYGASIVKGEHTYGGKDGHITYDTPITNDVLGYLSEEDVEKILTDIKNLEK